jgi:hypothetical protein
MQRTRRGIREEAMIGDKTEHFQGKGTDLSSLQAHIVQFLEADGYLVQASAPSAQGVVLQARKGRVLSGLIDADRAMTIAIQGSPDDFTVRIGIGRWLEHLATAVIETLLVSGLFLVVDVAETVWNVEIEDKLVRDIKSFVG